MEQRPDGPIGTVLNGVTSLLHVGFVVAALVLPNPILIGYLVFLPSILNGCEVGGVLHLRRDLALIEELSEALLAKREGVGGHIEQMIRIITTSDRNIFQSMRILFVHGVQGTHTLTAHITEDGAWVNGFASVVTLLADFFHPSLVTPVSAAIATY